EAAGALTREGVDVRPEIMVPLVGTVEELRRSREYVERTLAAVFDETRVKVRYKIGTMIELPRAALTAAQIAEQAEFFSFGTNDLTQTTFGFSRDAAQARRAAVERDR